MALALLETPYGYWKLDINHKNGQRYCNVYKNIEWATRTQNLVHAFKNNMRTDNQPIEIKNKNTQEVKWFYSASEAARKFNVTETTITNRCKRGSQYCYQGFQFRYAIGNKEPWPDPVDVSSGYTYRILVRHKTGEEKILTLNQCSDTPEYPNAITLKKYLDKNGVYLDRNDNYFKLLSKSPVSGTKRWNSSNDGKLSKVVNRSEASVLKMKQRQKEKKKSDT